MESKFYRNYSLDKKGDLTLKKYYKNIENEAEIVFRNITDNTVQENDTYKLVKTADIPNVLHRVSDLEPWIQHTRDLLIDLCVVTDPRTAIPILIQMLDEYYVGSRNQKPAWFGTAAKTLVGYLWRHGNITAKKPKSTQLKRLQRLLAFAFHLQNFEGLRLIAPIGGLEVSVNDSQLDFSDASFGEIREFNSCFSARGRIKRTLGDLKQTIWKNPVESVQAVERIINGGSPSEQEVFKDSILGQLSNDEPLEFWHHLWVRINLLVSVVKIRKNLTLTLLGPVLFSDVYESYMFESEQFCKTLSFIKWDESWYDNSYAMESANLLVDRPVVLIDGLYITSTNLLMDSINDFVESSLLDKNYPIQLSEDARENLISRPFEERAITLLRNYGFRAGKVMDDQVWYVEDYSNELLKHDETSFPGQIDVLAYHKKKGIVLLIECKVLSLPRNWKRVRNILGDLRSTGKDSYFEKLSKKVKWVSESSFFKSLTGGDLSFNGYLLLDRRLPGMNQSSLPAFDLQRLEEFINEITTGNDC